MAARAAASPVWGESARAAAGIPKVHSIPSGWTVRSTVAPKCRPTMPSSTVVPYPRRTGATGAASSRYADKPGDYHFDLDEAQSRRLAESAAALGVTINTVLQAGWALLLDRLTGHEGDVVFGATVSGRPAQLDGVESMVGLFINTIPVRVRFGPAESAATVIARIQARADRNIRRFGLL